ncbi:MAG: hypothetical protein QXR14_04375, partial [Sulfolobales archaeon]
LCVGVSLFINRYKHQLLVVVLLFDLAPKTSRKDLYDFAEELENLYRSYRNARLVAVVGPRRGFGLHYG